MGDMKKEALDWVSNNMTDNVSKQLSNNLTGAIKAVLGSPYTLALEMITILKEQKNTKYVVGVWSVVNASVLIAVLVISVFDTSFPTASWGLGIVLSSLVILSIIKLPINFSITSNLSEEIEKNVVVTQRKYVYESEYDDEDLTISGMDDDDEEDLAISGMDDDDDDEDLAISGTDDDDDENEFTSLNDYPIDTMFCDSDYDEDDFEDIEDIDFDSQNLEMDSNYDESLTNINDESLESISDESLTSINDDFRTLLDSMSSMPSNTLFTDDE